jgi:hypothetical protein
VGTLVAIDATTFGCVYVALSSGVDLSKKRTLLSVCFSFLFRTKCDENNDGLMNEFGYRRAV